MSNAFAIAREPGGLSLYHAGREIMAGASVDTLRYLMRAISDYTSAFKMRTETIATELESFEFRGEFYSVQVTLDIEVIEADEHCHAEYRLSAVEVNQVIPMAQYEIVDEVTQYLHEAAHECSGLWLRIVEQVAGHR